MFEKKHLNVVAGIVGGACVLLMSSPSLAQKPSLERIRKHYTLDKSNGQCILCHEKKVGEEPGRKNLNPFGKAIQADPTMKPLLNKDGDYKFSDKELSIMEAAVVKIENLDSDGDGVSNREELDLGSLPGDKTSVPDKIKLAKYRKEHPPVKAATAAGAAAGSGDMKK